MTTDYKLQILQHFDEVLALDLATAPNYATMKMIRAELVRLNMPFSLASRVVCKTHIAISDDIFADQIFMTQVVQKFAKVIVGIYTHAMQTYAESTDCFLDMVDGMSLTLSHE